MTNLGPRKALFLDRDGVINVDKGYVWRIGDFQFIDGAINALRRFQVAGYVLIIVTNQSGIARGLFSEADFFAITKHMLAVLVAEGVNVADVFHCPHLPDAPLEEFRVACSCRKPGPGMILAAINRWSVDPGRSLLVGDKVSDLDAGRAAGIRSCYLVTNGVPLGPGRLQSPDGVYSSLAEVAQVVLK